jgi:hypothetical protein
VWDGDTCVTNVAGDPVALDAPAGASFVVADPAVCVFDVTAVECSASNVPI